MAEILFKPICSECGKEIKAEIDYKRTDLKVIHMPDIIPNKEISPWCCPNCLSIFNRIVMPTKLPFDNSVNKEVTKS